MSVLRLLEAMEPLERAKTLEKAINGQAELVLASLGQLLALAPLSLWESVAVSQQADYHALAFRTEVDSDFLEFRNPEKIARAIVFGETLERPVVIVGADGGEDQALITFDFLEHSFGLTSQVALGEIEKRLAVVRDAVTGSRRFDAIKTLMMRYLDQTQGQGDLRGCIEFLLMDPEVEEGEAGKIIWTDFRGNRKESTRKTIQNRFGKCEKEWSNSH